MQDADAASVTLAWVATLLWIGAKGIPWWLRSPVERWLLPGVFALALALRVALPWGPLNFVDGERLECLWGTSRRLPETFLSVPALLSALRDAGVGLAPLLRWTGPLTGALAVLATYLAARGLGLRRGAGLLAAAVVCAWPAHLHYSTGLSFSVEGMMFWLGAFAVAAPGGAETPWRPVVLSALTVLGVNARPEYRLLVVPLAALVLGPGWSWKQRGVLAALLAAGLASYLPHLLPDEGSLQRSGHSAGFVPHLLKDPSMGPVWWIYAAALGLLVPTRVRWNARLALALSVALLGASYWVMASEANPRWGQWRYYVALVPPIALAAACFGEWLTGLVPEGRARHGVSALLVAIALAPLPFSLPMLRRAEDLSVEFAWLRGSAHRALGARRDVLILANRGHQGLSSIAIEGNPTMALATAFGPLAWPSACERARGGALSVRDLERVVAQCPETIDPARTLVYLGLSREEPRLEGLRARFELVPVEELDRSVALTSTMISRQCPGDPTGYTVEGPWGPPCRVHLGWYRLAPR
jgi:hypothetical protein